MKLARPALAIAVGAAMIVTGTAQAKVKPKPPKPVCNLVTDGTGDAHVVGPDPSVDAWDITSADIAADKKNITVVIRVKKLAKTAPTSAPTGMRWRFGFTAEDIPFSFGAHTDATGAVSYDAAYTDPIKGGQLYGGGVTGTFDTVKNEIHMTAPESLFASQATIKLGTVLSGLDASSGNEAAISDPTGKVVNGALLRVYPPGGDDAPSDKTYKVGALSCVTPGK